jgi:hypothetical protein
MGTMEQPKPSSPGSAQPEQRPLEPGQTTSASPRQQSPKRLNPQSPDVEDERNERSRNR